MDIVNGSTIPSEILDCIFKHCERTYRLGGWAPVLTPKSRLQPLLLVCKNWHGVAERRLYTSVSLGSDRLVRDRNGQKMAISGKDVCRRFCETVQNNSRLASLVRELHLGSTRLELEDTKMHIRLIGICKNVEKIELHGCDLNDGLAEDLKAALAKADLISLELSNKLLGDFWEADGTAMLPLSDLIMLLQNWPRIETIYANMGRGYYGTSGGETLLSPATGTCPALRAISVHGGYFGQTELIHLANISPRLENVSITVSNDCSTVLRQCLQIWSSSIKRFTIFTPSYGATFPADDGCPIICSPLPELRELWISSPFVTPSAMVFLPKLEKLNFRGEYSHGMELAQLIEKGEMPCLRDIDVAFSSPKSAGISPEAEKEMSEEVAKRLRRVCGKRGKRDIFVRDPYTVLEELEERYGYGYEEDECESDDNDWFDPIEEMPRGSGGELSCSLSSAPSFKDENVDYP